MKQIKIQPPSKFELQMQERGRAISNWWGNLDGVEKFGYGWILFILLMVIVFIVAFWNPVGMIVLSILLVGVFLCVSIFAAVVVVEHFTRY
jgi:hypothetical protein